jgi:hypothetical protein
MCYLACTCALKANQKVKYKYISSKNMYNK